MGSGREQTLTAFTGCVLLCTKGETKFRVHDLGMLYAGALIIRQPGISLVTPQEFNFRSALVNLPSEAPQSSWNGEAGKAGLLEWEQFKSISLQIRIGTA